MSPKRRHQTLLDELFWSAETKPPHLVSEIKREDPQLQITYIPIDLVYFNHGAVQRSAFTGALLGHGGADVPLPARPEPAGIIIMCAVGGGEASLLLPGGTATTDVLVPSLVGQYRVDPGHYHLEASESVPGCEGVKGQRLVVGSAESFFLTV